jgi:P-type conjugative transfer protein TrbJ
MNRKKSIACVGGLLGVLSIAGAASADVVFDPSNFAQNVEQVAHQVEVLRQMEQQIQNQLQMLQHWEFTRLGDLIGGMQRIGQVLRDAGDVYTSGDPAGQLNEQYPRDPRDYQSTTHDDWIAQRLAWEQRQRDSLAENRTVQNRVYGELDPTRTRVAEYVEQSNAAPGATAAVQASNELTATLVAQLQAMQAMEVTDARGDAEREAQDQAEAAYHEQRRQAVMEDWMAPSDTAPIAMPFGN